MIKPWKQWAVAIALSLSLVACSDDDSLEACTADPVTGTTTQVSATEAQVYTSIVIDATPNQVWSVLTDFESMPEWSSTFQGLQGDVRDGGTIEAIFPDGQGGFVAFPHILSYQEGMYFGWSDEIITLPGIVDNHFYNVSACGDQTLMEQSDAFVGSNDFVPPGALAMFLLADYQTFNEELKAEVERRF